ncbi:MAG: cyclase family protein, partial [Gaiellales bacterium]
MSTTEAAKGVASQRGTTLIDLSTELFNGMPAHALFPSPIILPYVNHLQAKAAGLGEPDDPMTYAINYISMLEHVGTHVDSPYHIGENGGDANNVVVFGHSAGGHLASLLATHSNYASNLRPAIRGLISMSGAYALNDLGGWCDTPA